MLEIIILILSVAANSILGLAVVVNNPKKQVNRLFFYLTLSLGLWSVITYFSLHPVGLSQITLVRLVLASAALQDFFVLTSFAVFPNGNLNSLKFIKPAIYYLIFVVLLTQTPLVFSRLNADSQPVVGPGIIFFMLLIFGYLGGAIYMLVKRFKKSSGQIKNQLRVVIFGVVTCFFAIVFTNFVLVSVFKNTSLISFAPLLTLILTGSMAYAILKHKLFDLRIAIARTIAYLLTFSLVIILYSGLAYLIGQIFSFNSNALSSSQRYFYIGLAVLTAVAFQPLKRFFDKTTNKFFFKDSYEPQDILDGVSNLLVRKTQLDEILHQTSKIIISHIKTTSCDFLVGSSAKGYKHHSPKTINDITFKHLTSLIKQHSGSLIITDNLAHGSSFRELLSGMGYAAIFRLSTHSSSVGYLLVGNKKNGEIISEQDEQVLAIIADELAIAVENAVRFEEIQQFNITLQQKVEEATLQLRKANIRLKELDKTKDEFISMASHQLRTPLTTIKGYLSMILEGDVGKVKAQEKDMIQQAFDSAQNMVDLIADLLNVSRLQSGKFVLENKPTDLAEMIDKEIKKLSEQATARKLKLTYDKPASIPILSLDEVKMRQVVMNFIDNAIYYTPAGGTIVVALSATKDTVSYTVTDSGMGVPKEMQHHLFSKFYRADNARKMRPDGTGLGLFMAKKVIVAQGGAIIFKSVEGQGSTFGFSFPRNKLES